MIDPKHVPPEEPVFPTLPPEVYTVEIEDLEIDRKPDTYKKPNPDGTQPEREQYVIKFKVLDPPEFKDRLLRAWVNTTLRVSTKSKRPGLAQFLKAVTGKDWTIEDREKLTGDFMNTLIGSKLRVSTQIETSKTGKEFSSVTSYLPVRT